MPFISNLISDLFHNKIILNMCTSFNRYFIVALTFINTLSLSVSLLGSFFFDWGTFALTDASSFFVQWSYCTLVIVIFSRRVFMMSDS